MFRALKYKVEEFFRCRHVKFRGAGTGSEVAQTLSLSLYIYIYTYMCTAILE